MKFIKRARKLILSYEASIQGSTWIYEEIKSKNKVTIGKRFTFKDSDIISRLYEDPEDEFEPIEFKLADLKGDYYKVQKRKLNLNNDLYIYKDIDITRKTFIAERDISIFGRINKLTSHDIYIGGAHSSAIPESEFNKLLSQFPTSNELTRYADSRVAGAISEYLELNDDDFTKFQKARNTRRTIIRNSITQDVAEYEALKYEAIHKKLSEMLKNQNNYSEHDWQLEISSILQVLNPKYIHVFREPRINDTFNNINRRVDFLLVDENGSIDIAEIKKPSHEKLVTKGTYRNNHVPMRELSGTIMQLEKYIFLLNRLGINGEKSLNQQYKTHLGESIQIQIINPNGYVILGRSDDLSASQKLDFEVVRRKYKNLIDIMTYDDLLQRLERIIKHWKMRI